jgi:hypothetical protein
VISVSSRMRGLTATAEAVGPVRGLAHHSQRQIGCGDGDQRLCASSGVMLCAGGLGVWVAPVQPLPHVVGNVVGLVRMTGGHCDHFLAQMHSLSHIFSIPCPIAEIRGEIPDIGGERPGGGFSAAGPSPGRLARPAAAHRHQPRVRVGEIAHRPRPLPAAFPVSGPAGGFGLAPPGPLQPGGRLPDPHMLAGPPVAPVRLLGRLPLGVDHVRRLRPGTSSCRSTG